MDLFFAQTSGPAGSFALGQAGQAIPLVAVNPILYRTRCISEQPRHLRTGQALRHQQYSMQPMIVPGLFRTLDLLLQTEHRSHVCDPKWSHDSRRTLLGVMRKYL